MLMPSIFGENFMDDFFGVPERTYTQSAQNALMKTDVVENKDGFDVSIDLPLSLIHISEPTRPY